MNETLLIASAPAEVLLGLLLLFLTAAAVLWLLTREQDGMQLRHSLRRRQARRWRVVRVLPPPPAANAARAGYAGVGPR